MDKPETLQRIIDIENEIQSLPKFKGKAGYYKQVKGHRKFLTLYKTDEKLERFLLRACEDVLRGVQEFLDRDKIL